MNPNAAFVDNSALASRGWCQHMNDVAGSSKVVSLFISRISNAILKLGRIARRDHADNKPTGGLVDGARLELSRRTAETGPASQRFRLRPIHKTAVSIQTVCQSNLNRLERVSAEFLNCSGLIVPFD